ncbi:uncharacterized protein ANIA_11300 [Aspergillus nidulans FGSC A4]|uniref:Uncharacterized protein n=1 Tax=Emericella nidulans (strain FGSC A4 / ATCC 38163 / CBS 112.46 / NRRL 194 / M139) TaxID=227321 RepID=C8VS59_EMENI|nr:hypothetical protein [Aspergillus nidulans FGSC A4]CBF87720.1 TPA: hypothetical protein ANIA_11300 [Aspergillus nidulans FGSC A4]
MPANFELEDGSATRLKRDALAGYQYRCRQKRSLSASTLGQPINIRSHGAANIASAETNPKNQSRLVRRENPERASPKQGNPGCQNQGFPRLCS